MDEGSKSDKVDKIIKSADRIEKVKDWLKNPYNATLVGIIALAFIVRLYFFVKTSGQTLWYDEADYMSTAKSWALGIPYEFNAHRPPLFMMLGALGFMVGLGENILKFILVLLPSTTLVYVVYLLGKEMYDEKIGLIAAFLTSLSWTLLFWTNRFQPDYFSMCFSVLAIFFMWKYWKTDKTKLIVWAGIFSALGLMFKVSALLVPMAFILFIFCKERFSALRNKNYYWFSLAFILTLLPYLIWSYIKLGTALSFTAGYSSAVVAAAPFAWKVIPFFYAMSENILFILFLLGAVIGLRFLLYADVIAKDKTKAFNPDLFSILMLLTITAFYVFYIRSIEDRWVFLWLPFMFFLVGNALMFIYNAGKKYTKIISIIVVLILLGIGGYMQFSHAKTITDSKIESYAPVKEAALWMKDNSNPGDKIFTVSYPQTVYYSERNVLRISSNSAEEFNRLIEDEMPVFIEISIFENHPEWLYNWPAEKNYVVPVQAYYGDAAKKQPVLIVYQINYDLLKVSNATETNYSKKAVADTSNNALNSTL